MTNSQVSRSPFKYSRRSIVVTGSKLAYSAPLITASLGLTDLRAHARNTVSENAGDSESKTGNQDPIAVAGENFSVVDDDGDGFAQVTLNGGSSGDPDGTVAAYSWILDRKVISRDSTTTVRVPVGVHRFKLKVTDDKGASAQATITVEVEQGPSQKKPTEPPNLPDPPHDLKAVQKKQEIALTWLFDGGGQPTYRVYRTIDDGSDKPMDKRDWTKIGEEQSQLSWRDDSAEIGVPYLYTVRSFDGLNESQHSNIAAIVLQPAPTNTPQSDSQQETQPSPTETPTEVPTEEAKAEPTRDAGDPSTPTD